MAYLRRVRKSPPHKKRGRAHVVGHVFYGVSANRFRGSCVGRFLYFYFNNSVMDESRFIY